jgi:hypothetical protein
MSDETKRTLERIIREIKEAQSTVEWESQESGYLGEAMCALAMALGRHVP